jgi:hypothetical protein
LEAEPAASLIGLRSIQDTREIKDAIVTLAKNQMSASSSHQTHSFYVDRVLKGAESSDLPIQAPIKYQLVVPAKALSIDMPMPILVRIDEVNKLLTEEKAERPRDRRRPLGSDLVAPTGWSPRPEQNSKAPADRGSIQTWYQVKNKMQMDSRTSTILGVQYLRAVAALMVAYWHLRIQIPAYTEYLTPHWAVDTDRLRAGVDIFFVISLGDASYSIYLTHVFTLGITRSVWSSVRIGGSGHAALYAIISMVAVAVAAVLTYRWVEEPLLRLSKRLIAVRRDVRVGFAVERR